MTIPAPSSSRGLRLLPNGLVILLCSLVFMLMACEAPSEDSSARNDKQEDAETTQKEEAILVETAGIVRGPIESLLKTTANLEAEKSVQVLARTGNHVVDLLVEEGDSVKEGQVLARLDDGSQQNSLDKIKVQLDNAVREYQRQKSLFEKNLISDKAFYDATFEKEQLEISFKDAARELSYTKIIAPIDGVITKRMINLGDQVNLNQHLFDIVDFDSIVARIYVPEKHLAQLSPGLPARVAAQALGSREFDGSITRIAPTVDAQTGTVKVTVGVNDRQQLRPGLYVDVTLVLETKSQALLVPKKALIYDNDQVFVFRMVGADRVERLRIEPVLQDRYHVEPRTGLAEEDRIVVAGQAGLKDGALVRLAEPTESAETTVAQSEQD